MLARNVLVIVLSCFVFLCFCFLTLLSFFSVALRWGVCIFFFVVDVLVRCAKLNNDAKQPEEKATKDFFYSSGIVTIQSKKGEALSPRRGRETRKGPGVFVHVGKKNTEKEQNEKHASKKKLCTFLLAFFLRLLCSTCALPLVASLKDVTFLIVACDFFFFFFMFWLGAVDSLHCMYPIIGWYEVTCWWWWLWWCGW